MPGIAFNHPRGPADPAGSQSDDAARQRFNETVTLVREWTTEYLAEVSHVFRGNTGGQTSKSIAQHLARTCEKFPKLGAVLSSVHPDPRMLKNASHLLNVVGFVFTANDVAAALSEGRYDDAAAETLGFGAAWVASSMGAAAVAAGTGLIGVTASPAILAVAAVAAGYAAFEYVGALAREHHVGEHLADAAERVAAWWNGLWANEDPKHLVGQPDGAAATAALELHRQLRASELVTSGVSATDAAALGVLRDRLASEQYGVPLTSLLVSRSQEAEQLRKLSDGIVFDKAELATTADAAERDAIQRGIDEQVREAAKLQERQAALTRMLNPAPLPGEAAVTAPWSAVLDMQRVHDAAAELRRRDEQLEQQRQRQEETRKTAAEFQAQQEQLQQQQLKQQQQVQRLPAFAFQ